MFRSMCCALVAFGCLFSIGNSDLDLWRDNIRNNDNQVLAARIRDEFAYSTPAPAAYSAPAPASYSPPLLASPPSYSPPLLASPPLLSPGLVSGNSGFRMPPVGSASAGVAGNVDVAASDTIARNVFTFGQNLSRQINKTYKKTIILSPLSLMTCLALLLLGSKGRSYAELASVFGLSDMVTLHEQFGLMTHDVQQPTRQTTSPQRQLDSWRSNPITRSLRNYPTNRNSPPEVVIANGLFIQQGYSLNPDYRQVTLQVYKAELQTYDFIRDPERARVSINSWVENKTRGKIQNIIAEPIDTDTRIILANALYFKAMWEIDFIGGATKVESFFPNGEGTQPVLPVDMMVGAGSFPYYEDQQMDCRILGLPYHGNLSTMYIIQPMRSSVQQLAYLEQGLNADAIEFMISQMRRRSTIVAFPKLHITETLELRDILRAMGLGSMFSPIQNDLSLIFTNGATRGRSSTDATGSLRNLVAQRQAAEGVPTPPSDLIVSQILHKVDFIVDEKGTEAAAATVALVKKSGPEILFRADTPFLLLVRSDLTKLPLFYGMINEPPTAKGSSASPLRPRP